MDKNETRDRISEESFRGEIGKTVSASKPFWSDVHRPAKGSPNIVYIILDDVGFAHLGCYGSSIRTPAMDRLASGGIQYTNFHVTSICSASRACFLTGRNHHSVGMGFIGGYDTGYPAYRGLVTPKAATLAEILKSEGYGTYAVGKWHLVPPAHLSSSGPFEHWPLGKGFERYYGFLWAEDDQYSPQLWSDNHCVDPPRRDGYHVSDDFVDNAKGFVSDHLSAGQDRPFFLQLAFGAAHAPHQAPKSFIDGYRGKFDHGWDEERRRVLERQIKKGVVPANTKLSPRNYDVQPWIDLSADQRRLYARMQEVFAGFMEHTDSAIGGFVDFLKAQNVLDNTIIVLVSDNGATNEGGPHGSSNEYQYFMQLESSLEENLSMIDELGGPLTHNHYPAGWGQTGNTPLRLYKKYTYGGGVRAPFIIHWPKGITRPGTLSRHFHHATDVVPTVLDATGTKLRGTYAGVEQMPIHGESIAYTFVGDEPSKVRSPQYFEMIGHRGIWADGWKAVTQHVPKSSYDDEPWGLYHLSEDVAELNDLAKDYPEKLEELKALWWRHANRFGVLPLDDRLQERGRNRGPFANRQYFRLLPGTRQFSHVAGPNFVNRSFTITAHAHRSSKADEGVLLAHGRRAAGFSFFIQDGHLLLDYNLVGRHQVLKSSSELAVGKLVLEVQFTHLQMGKAAVTLRQNGEDLASAEFATMTGGFGCLSTQCGHNSPLPVSTYYECPYTYSGGLDCVEVTFPDPPDPVATDTTTLLADLAQE